MPWATMAGLARGTVGSLTEAGRVSPRGVVETRAEPVIDARTTRLRFLTPETVRNGGQRAPGRPLVMTGVSKPQVGPIINQHPTSGSLLPMIRGALGQQPALPRMPLLNDPPPHASPRIAVFTPPSTAVPRMPVLMVSPSGLPAVMVAQTALSMQALRSDV